MSGMVLAHTSPPHPSGSKQNCLRPDMPYQTGYTGWSGLDVGLFIAAGVLVTAGLYECNKALQTTHTPPIVPPAQGVHYVPSDISQYTGLNLAPQAPQAPAGVLLRRVSVPVGNNATTDWKVAESEIRIDQKDQRVCTKFYKSTESTDKTTSAEKTCKCSRDASDETRMTGGGQVSESDVEKVQDFCGNDVTSDVTNSRADEEEREDDVGSRTDETRPRRADFTQAEVLAVTACPVRHELSAATREAIGSTHHDTDKTDSEISMEEFLSEDVFFNSEQESASLSQPVPVSPRLQRKLRCAVLYAEWREDSQYCSPDDVTTNQKVRFSWFGQEDDHDLDDVSEVKIYCAVLEGVWREDGGLVENHVTRTAGGDDVMEPYYPGHGHRNSIQSGNENWI
ncbi:PREDICTED: uncharacterized protein LOC109486493 [Branchiostoma belcheri]|uniref:Uncharacterized protein LOC109486493 n=1 Tax=Branchiostoma belcheri TaxID=7741 RepID=A0A6P5AHV4_BRABE|nr:PREDICTED: uncharacterized protein LOC109486493 [Branchiostoma belcheri]